MAAAHHRFTEMQFNGKAKQSGAKQDIDKPGSKPRAKQGRVKKEAGCQISQAKQRTAEDAPLEFKRSVQQVSAQLSKIRREQVMARRSRDSREQPFVGTAGCIHLQLARDGDC